MTIKFMLLVSRQGKVRLSKWYSNEDTATKTRLTREISTAVLARGTRMCNVLEWRGVKVIYKRYASLFFITGVDDVDNELITLEYIHHYVECLDRYFGNVCELDIIFNFHQAYYLLDEVFIGGLIQETSKKEILKVCAAQDDLLDDSSDDKRKPAQPKPK